MACELVRARSCGVCELCRTAAGSDFSHRLGRGRGGPWTPSNGCRLCRPCHTWLGEYPLLAEAGGWHLKTGQDPLTTPVWLDGAAGPGWWLLDDEGQYLWLDAAELALGVPQQPAAGVLHR